jgi:hypothetical protein
MRLFFWLILGSLSVFFAEVMSGSDIYPFYKLVSWLMVFPLYTLHTLVLWSVVFRRGRSWLYALFPAGAIFGLYEAYITKVIWSPSWDSAPIYLGGVAVVETLLLVLFWHAFMAFIIPLFLAETALTSSREVFSLLPGWAKRALTSGKAPVLAATLVFAAGVFQSIGTPTPLDSLASGLLNSGFLILLVLAWRRAGGHGYSLRELLPSPRGFKAMLALLGLVYLALGLLLRPEELPELGAQATVWAMYALFGLLIRRGIRLSRSVEQGGSNYDLEASPGRMVSLAALFTAGSVLGSLTGLGFAFAMAVWIVGIAFGLFVFGQTVRHLF